MDEDLTLTRKMGNVADFASSWDDITGVQVHPAFVGDKTPTFKRTPRRAEPIPESFDAGGGWARDSRPLAMQPASTPYASPLQSVTEVDVVPYGAMPSRVECEPVNAPAFTEPVTRVAPHPQSLPSGQPVHFVSAAPVPVALPELSRPKIRARFDSDASTWRKTIPALRRMVGLPGAAKFGNRALPLPSPELPEAGQGARAWSPVLSVAVAVSLVAMVVMTVVGFTTKAADVGREARIRVVSASGPTGQLLNAGKVFVDGAVQCEALPCELELASGEHWVTVKSPGFETPPSRSVSMGSDQTARVHFELNPMAAAAPAVTAQAAVRPVAAVEAIPVEVAPTLTQQPAALLPVPAVTPKRPAPSLRAPRRARFVAPSARLNINAIPAANVVLDGRPQGRTPLMGVRVKPGAHSVVLIGPNGRRISRSASVSAGKTATVAARF